MGIEIERKYLLSGDDWRARVTRSVRMEQGYLVDAAAFEAGLASCSVRVRIAGEDARLNVKSARLGIIRDEYEYPLPPADARAMLDTLCRGRVEKTRHYVEVEGWTFEVDEFHADNQGLVVAEIELPAADAVHPHPSWLGREVSDLPRYYNVQLIARPFVQWTAAERAGEGGH